MPTATAILSTTLTQADTTTLLAWEQLLCLIGPEVAVGATFYAAVSAAIADDALATYVVGGLISTGGSALGAEIGDGIDKQLEREDDRPRKAGGDGSASAATSSQNQDWHQGKGNNWYPDGAPYSGSPHGPPPFRPVQ